MIHLHTQNKKLTFDTRAAAELFAETEGLDENLCVLHADGRVLSFRRKGDSKFTTITKREGE
jgi:hypothetical protein